MKVSTWQLDSDRRDSGRELNILGPETWNDEFLSCLILAEAEPGDAVTVHSLPLTGDVAQLSPQFGTSPSSVFHV